MAKRLNATTSNHPRLMSSTPANANGGDAVEQRVVAFAEQLGRLAGTVQAKTEGWLDRETLKQQISGIRDSAADLIAHLTSGDTAARSTDEPASARARVPRSGGKVDAPGKKHRQPPPSDPAVRMAANRVTTMTTPRARAATGKRRGRG